jgi:general secretion pathway protein F
MQFELKVLDQSGALSTLVLEAHNEADAETQATALGYSSLSISKHNSLNIDWLSRKPVFDILLFSQELVALLHAGLSLVNSIETLTEKSSDKTVQQILQTLLQKLHEGQTFSSALGALPETFPSLFIAMAKASEKTGDLKQALQRYVLYRTQLEQVRTKLITASIYPVLLLLVGALVSIFLLGYVVPKFSAIYDNVGDNIPFMSRMLMKWGHLLHEHSAYVAGLGFALIVLAIFIFTRKYVQTRLMAWLWSIPNLGEKLRLYQLARFYRTLGMLLQGGTPLVTALQMSADLLGSALHAQLQHAIQQVKEGQPLSVSLEQHGLATAVSKRMMSVGEQAGNMGEMMENTASFYDHEIARWVDWLTRLIEPLLMLLIGLMIGGIVILMYLPIFELADSIQ